MREAVPVWVYKSEIGEMNTQYASSKRRLLRVVEPLVTLLDYPTVQASQISIKGHIITIYRNGDDDQWTSDFESVVRFLPKRTT